MEEEQHEIKFWKVYGFCLGISVLFMFFFGLNSPIYTFNSHCDYQWFVTMGRGILAGKVPYRDLFEQKGPLTYFLFAFAALFPNIQFAIWCCEIFCISLFLYFSYRITRKFLSPLLSLTVLPIVMMMLSMNRCRGLDGSCVEEYCLPIFAYGLLCFLDFILDSRSVTWRRSLVIGICLGILFWVKFTMWEFFFIPMLIWVVTNLVHHKFVEILKAGGLMLGGVLIVTIPILIGFAVVGALDDLFRVYFYLNLTHYRPDKMIDASSKILGKSSVVFLLSNAWFCILLVIGVIGFAVQYWKYKSGWLLLVSVVGTFIMTELIGGVLYYYMPLFSYGILGGIYLVKYVSRVLISLEVIIKKKLRVICLTSLVLICFLVSIPLVSNIVEINRPRENYAPLVVADIIAEYNITTAQPATLFCYRMSDCGFYNAAQIIPNVYYYAENSFDEKQFPEMYAAFDDTISNQICDFVVTYDFVYQEKKDFLSIYYHPYMGTVEDSTLQYVFHEPGGYEHCKIVILFRK